MLRLHSLGLPAALFLSLAACSLLAPEVPGRLAQAVDPIPIERIMGDPVWIGQNPQSARWSEDGQSLWYRRSLPGLAGSEWVRLDFAGQELERISPELARQRFPEVETSPDGSLRLLERAGDLYLEDRSSGGERRLTRTEAREGDGRFLAGGQRIVYRRGATLVVRDLADGFEEQPAVLLLEDDPETKEKDDDEPGFLSEQQERLFEHVREAKRRAELEDEREQAADELARMNAPPRFYLGEEYEDLDAYLAPDGQHLLVRLEVEGSKRGKRDTMPRYVTASGLVETESVRTKVGSGTWKGHSLALLDLKTREQNNLPLDSLTGIADDPLAELRAGAQAFRDSMLREANAEPKTAEAKEEEMEAEAPAEAKESPDEARPRAVWIQGLQWNETGTHALARARSTDNKDDWLFVVDAARRELIEVEHLRDEAWINGRLRDFGWLTGARSLWFVSEASGWAQLYRYDLDRGTATALTEGEWEVSDVRSSEDGRWLYFIGNPDHPGRHELYRISTAGGEIEALTSLGGRNEAWLSPDESRWLVLHSGVLDPPELFLQDNRPGAEARQLTHATSPEFRALPWVEPEVHEVPSRHGRPIWSRVYRPAAATDPGHGRRPAVVFVHGAGYLQNAHLGWSGYFREFMFHSLLAHRGYVVLDMDYRASAGYGRDWRTAIYRQMGTPELEDLEDGVRWLVAEQGVDPARVGVYGGSYGGFLTLMALFQKPQLFACGAALRPVTDWAHYNHGYTSNILNTPEVDPEAYWRSSPIEHAAGLERPLLMCHGMLDDNVFFQDTVRLAQRLIELEKEDWEVALFPVEPHGFREPASWLNEYRRILSLMERYCRNAP